MIRATISSDTRSPNLARSTAAKVAFSSTLSLVNNRRTLRYSGNDLPKEKVVLASFAPNSCLDDWKVFQILENFHCFAYILTWSSATKSTPMSSSSSNAPNTSIDLYTQGVVVF